MFIKTRSLIVKTFMLVGILLVGSVGMFSSAYEMTPHDNQFSKMFSYRIEELITQRGEIFRPKIITILHHFATQFAIKDPRFSSIINSVADIIMSQGNSNVVELPQSSGFEVKNKVNEKNSSVWLTNAYKDPAIPNHVVLDMKINPNLSLEYHQIPHILGGRIETQNHCYIYGSTQFSGSTQTSLLDAPRNTNYVMSYLHVPLYVDTPVEITHMFSGYFLLPPLSHGNYTFMCSIVLADSSKLSPLVYRSSYYYFDIKID